MLFLILDRALDRFTTLPIRDGKQIGVRVLGVAEVIDPATRVVAAKYVALICLDNQKRRTFVVTVFVESLRDVQSQSALIPSAARLSVLGSPEVVLQELGLLLMLDSLLVKCLPSFEVFLGEGGLH